MANKYRYINPEIYYEGVAIDALSDNGSTTSYRCPLCDELSKCDKWKHFNNYCCEVYIKYLFDDTSPLQFEIKDDDDNEYYAVGCTHTNNLQNIISLHWCEHCKNTLIFNGSKLISPTINKYIKPNELLNQYTKAKTLFDEFTAVANDSPRAGLTLARMCLESLVNDILTNKGETLDEKFYKNINKLLELGIINERIRQFLDNVRVIGNKATHNFKLIEEGDVTVEDCVLVYKAINHILDNIKQMQELDSDLEALKDKVKE